MHRQDQNVSVRDCWTVKRLVTDTKQEENEDLMTHTKRFKQANDMFKQTVGDNWLDEFAVHTAEHTSTSDNDEQTKMKEEASEKFATFVHMKNSETRKHRKPLSSLKEQCALGNDQCPKTLQKANDALTNHKWDHAWNNHLKEMKKQ